MAGSTAGVTLDEVLFETDHPFLFKTEAELEPHDGVEQFQPQRKIAKYGSSSHSTDEPVWYQNHRDAYAARGDVWVHPSKRPELQELSKRNKWVAALPPREKCLLGSC